MPTTDSLRAELARIPSDGRDRLAAISPMDARLSYARELAASGLLPAAYRRSPANVLYAIEYGQMLDLSPIAAMVGVHVIEGKPTASAGLVAALVRRAGHRLRVRGNDRAAQVQIVRADDPEWTFESEWTIERARTSGLTSKDVWKKYPAAMLKARAITECARDACNEVLLGLSYTAEELGYDSDHHAVISQSSGGAVLDAPEIDVRMPTELEKIKLRMDEQANRPAPSHEQPSDLAPPAPEPPSPAGGASSTGHQPELPRDDRAAGYAALADVVEGPADLRAIWTDAGMEGVLDFLVGTGQTLREVLTARARALTAAEGIDAEVTTDEEGSR